MSVQDNSSLLSTIIAEIRSSSEQKITFARYMDLCLYHEKKGYYNSPEIKIGQGGDFVTSVSISIDFAELLAKQLYELWHVLDKPNPFSLVEMGAGEGQLAKNILLCFVNNYPDIIDSLQYIIVEKSIPLQQRQELLLTQHLPTEIQIKWTQLDEITNESIVGCFFSNELVDAMPVHLVKWYQGQLKEVYLTYYDGKISEQLDTLSTDKINKYFLENEVDFNYNYPQNYQTEVNLQALNWLKKISEKLQKGFLLTIDYGYQAKKYYHPQRSQGTLKCYFQHRHHDNPYVNIGKQDITCHVNFTALQKYGLSYGLINTGYIEQALFLMNLGLGERLQNLSTGQIQFSEIISRRNQLHQLINPQGLGNFKVLLQSKNIEREASNKNIQGFKQLNI